MISKNWITDKVVRNAPIGVKMALRLTPQVVSTRVLELALNQFFKDELNQQKLTFIGDKKLRIEIQDLEYSFITHLSGRRLQVRPDTGDHDVSFRGHFNDLFLLSTQRVDPDTLFFRRRLMITGDTEFGLELKNLLDTIELSTRLPPYLNKMTSEMADIVEQQMPTQ
ncbi:MAG: SCP2 sterol-binding domain-containing protein [Idiomarina sp.]|nr:SCP2 sterol-binding domain-containing protein [Idiomarina sp.]